MLTDGLYRDKDGQTAYVRLTVTGYLICYTDGRTIAVPARPSPISDAPNRPDHQRPQAGQR